MEELDNIEITRQTYDKNAASHAEAHWDASFWTEEEEKFESYLSGGAKILDVGCGSGRDTTHFMERGYDVVGIDFSSGQIAEARKRVPNGNFLIMDMRDLKFDPESFDGLWCCSSLLHFRRDEIPSTLSSLNQVLRKDGVIFISLRKREEREEWRKYPDGTARFFSYYDDAGEFKTMLEESGFSVMDYNLKSMAKDSAPYNWHCYYARKS